MLRAAAVLFGALSGAPLALGACAGEPVFVYDYPIVLKNQTALAGQRVEKLAAFARDTDGTWKQVPLQVDEVNAEGDYVLAHGLPFTKATDDGWLDANDELALRGEDLGRDFKPTDVPQWVKDKARASWKASFCRDGRVAGHLLVVGTHKSEATTEPLDVKFDDKAQTVDTALYSYKFDRVRPALLGEVAMKKPSGPVPIIASSKFLMPLRTPFFMPDMTFVDQDFSSEVECWQTGPVRSIVAVGVKYSAFLSVLKLHLFSELVFYRRKFEIPTKIEFIFDPTTFLRPGSGLFYALVFPKGKAWAIDSNLVPLPAKSAADVVDKGPKASMTEEFYARGSQESFGSFLVKVRVDAKARAEVPPPFIIRAKDFDDAALAQHWDWLAQSRGDLGVYLDISQVPQGLYDFGLDLLLSPKAHDTFTDYGPIAAEWLRL